MKKKDSIKKGPLGTPLGNPISYFNNSRLALRKAQEGGEEGVAKRYFLNKETKNKEKEKEITENRANRIANRYSKQEGSRSGKDELGRDVVISGRNPKKFVSREDDERSDYYGVGPGVKTKKRIIPKIFKTGGQAGTSGTGKYVSGVQTYGAGYKGNPNSPKPFVGVAPAKRKGGSVKSKRK